ncbi:MAG: hypothetical protein GX235_08780 [Clostridiales bacterium]|nr:hypothetical protein [Clostridiales bacterium]
MRKNKKSAFIEKKYWAATLLFTAIILFCGNSTVMSQEKNGTLADRQYYRSIENEHIGEIRNVLEECGYNNCGITMTKVTQKDVPNEYTILIHHKRFKSLDDDGKERLKTELSEVRFQEEQSRFSYVLLEPGND